MSKLKKWLAWIGKPLLTVTAMVVATALGTFTLTDVPERLGLTQVAESSVHDRQNHAAEEEAEDHDHNHEGHAEENSIELSEQARANLKLTTQSVSVGKFTDYIEVPAVIEDWPGRTHLSITSPLTGVIHSIEIARGELTTSGSPLFTLRLTHQDLVETQADFLTSLGRLDVEDREIQRLTAISSSGAIAGKTRLAREYERDKLLAGIRTARQSMLLHGLTEAQIEFIERERKLVREVTVFAPTLHADRSLHHSSELYGEDTHGSLSEDSNRFQGFGDFQLASTQSPQGPDHIETEFLVTQLDVALGQSVQAGDQLGKLSDYSKVLVRGDAFQRDGDALQRTANSGDAVQVVIETADGPPRIIDDLQIAYIGNEVDRESRALPFYVSLPNEVEHSEQVGDRRYVSWRYKPGQRMRLRIPVSSFENAIVVPLQAVAEEGPERFVFVENNEHFDRVSVHILNKNSTHVAIANDGQLWPGQSVAVNGAHQLQMAMKNRSGGAIDPHAGHNH